MNSKYHIVCAANQDQLEKDGYTAENEADSIKEARRKAKYMLSDEFQTSNELSQPMTYVQIKNRTGKVEEDFFRQNSGLHNL